MRAKYEPAIVELPGPTRGAAETVLIGLRGLSSACGATGDARRGDYFYEGDIVSQYRAVCHKGGGVFCFFDTQPKPSTQAHRLRPHRQAHRPDQEKVKIWDHANTGCYHFDGNELMSQCQQLLDRGNTQLSQDKVGEYYTSGVIGSMIEEGATFTALLIDPARMHVLGTPTQLQEWSVRPPSPPPLRVCFDLDHTLLTAPSVPGDYSSCQPIEENVACLALRGARCAGLTPPSPKLLFPSLGVRPRARCAATRARARLASLSGCVRATLNLTWSQPNPLQVIILRTGHASERRQRRRGGGRCGSRATASQGAQDPVAGPHSGPYLG